MQVKKNWFNNLALLIFLFAVFYILTCILSNAGSGQEYPYYAQGMLLLLLMLSLGIAAAVSLLAARWRIPSRMQRHPRAMLYAECAAVIAVLSLAAVVRLVAIRYFPMQPQSDYKTFYEVADLLNKGTLAEDGPGYCEYIAMFPHVFGFSYALSLVFRLTGTSVIAGQYFGLLLSLGSILFTYRIARGLGGKAAGLIALGVSAFWPSQILYTVFISSEQLFTFMMLGCIWLFIYLVKNCKQGMKRAGGAVTLHIVLGVALALTSAVRPMGLVLMIAFLICLIPGSFPLKIRLRNETKLSERFLSKGWLRGLLIVASYFLMSAILSKGISYTIEQEIPGTSVSFGYNLLVGLNQQSDGGWNEDDSEYLYASLEATGSAVGAQSACRDLAFQRFSTDPRALLNLFVHKFQILWANDDYGSTWNILFADENTMTKEKESILFELMDFNNGYYLVVLFFAALWGLYMWRKKFDWTMPLILMFLGTIALHLLVENQNRYHYHILPVFAILAAMAAVALYRDLAGRLWYRQKTSQVKRQLHKQEIELRERMEEAQNYLLQKQKESMQTQFDMEKALKEGHIKMSVSQAYQEAGEQPLTENKEQEHEEKSGI